MKDKQFINNLSSVLADIRKLDAKKIFLDNKDILERIKENTAVIKHSQDTRETVYADDLWGQWVETKEDGTIVIHDDWVTNPNASSNSAWLSNVKAVQDNKAYSEITTDDEGNFTGVVEDSVIANIQTDRIKDGEYMFDGDGYLTFTSFSGDLSNLVNGTLMFYNTGLTSFNGNLSSLVHGWNMFGNCINLTSFNGNLSSLVHGLNMFGNCINLTSFSSDLSSLVHGWNMFGNCTSLTYFSGDLSSLTNGDSMFLFCNKLSSFSGNLSRLVNGTNMFGATIITSFNGDLSSLVNGYRMFASPLLTSFSGDLSSLIDGTDIFSRTSLNPQSVMYIVESIKNIAEEKAKYTNGEIPWVTYDSTTQKYSAPFGFMENGDYVYTYNNPDTYTTTVSSSNVGQLTLGINVSEDPETIAQQLQTFAEGCLYNSWELLKQAFVDKGWTVTFQYGGTSTTITLP